MFKLARGRGFIMSPGFCRDSLLTVACWHGCSVPGTKTSGGYRGTGSTRLSAAAKLRWDEFVPFQ